MLMLPIVIMTMPEGEERDYMELLYTQYHRMMLSTAWKYNKDKAAVEDIVSDSCVALMKKVPLLRNLDENSRRSYIVSAVRNTALNYFKRNKMIHKYVSEADTEALSEIADRHDWEREIALQLELDAVWAAILQLPEKEREIMRMKYALEMTDAEIAKEIGLSVRSITKYVSRARAKLKAMFYRD